MKQSFTLLKTLLITILSAISFTAWAAPVTGPSVAYTTAASIPSTVAKYICTNGAINLSVPSAPNVRYQWYKLDASNNPQLVKDGTAGDNSYTETAAGAGTYTYEVMAVSTSPGNCTSGYSQPINVFVLPPINATVQAPTPDICTNQAGSQLNLTGLDPNFQYTYQWTEGTGSGTAIPGATSNIYTISSSTPNIGTAGSIVFGVQIAYQLNPSCTSTATPATVNVHEIPTAPTITAN